MIPVDDTQKYFISVLPIENTYTNSGRMVARGQTSVTVKLDTLPIKTATVSVIVFEDNSSINAALDEPAEHGLKDFTVVLSDALGMVSVDVWGNMLGTTYLQNPDGSYVLDPDGNPIVEMMGSGVLVTDADGVVVVKNLAPNAYIVTANPPPGTDWVLTGTVDGSRGNFAWVMSADPTLFTADWVTGPAYLVLDGFVHQMQLPPGGTTGNITGQVVYVHTGHPPNPEGIAPGRPVKWAWVGLNDLNAAPQRIYAMPCDADGNFNIQNVPPGTYELVLWDTSIDAIMDFRVIDIPATGGTVALGQVPIFAWFGQLIGSVFMDSNENGFRDPGEPGIPNQVVNLRQPDSSIVQSTFTDPNGNYYFDEVPPNGHNLIVEVDYARYKPTGVTVQVDDGGTLAPGAIIKPQPQIDSLATANRAD